MKATGTGFLRSMLFFIGLASVQISSVAQSPVPPPAHPITAQQVRDLMEVTHATDRMRDGIHKLVAQQKASLPYFPDAFWTDFEAEFTKLDWVAIATPIYQKYLSEEDAAKSLTFYKTEAGQHALDAGFAVNTEMTQAGFDQGKIIGARVGQKYQQQIEENMRKAQQPVSPAAPK